MIIIVMVSFWRNEKSASVKCCISREKTKERSIQSIMMEDEEEKK